MSWPAVEAALDGILARGWYTNHGPLAQQLEAAVADTLQVRHAIAVTNPTIGLIMLLEALAPSGSMRGPVLLPGLAPLRCAQALRWTRLRAGFVDCGAALDDAMAREAEGRAGAVLIASDQEVAWADLAWDRGVPVLSDGIVVPGVPSVLRLPGCGDAAGAACVLTDDDALAARLRNIRSSYGAGPPVPVRRTANGRLSEAQAAMSLLAWPPGPAPWQGRVRGPVQQVIRFGDGLGLVVGTAADRARLLSEIPGTVPFAAGAPPGACPRAEAMAGRMVLLPGVWSVGSGG